MLKEFEALAHYRRLQTELKRAKAKYAEVEAILVGKIKSALTECLAENDPEGAKAARKDAEKRRADLVALEAEITSLEQALPLAKQKAYEAAKAEFEAVVKELAQRAQAVMPQVQEAASNLEESAGVLDTSWREYHEWRRAWAAHFSDLPSKVTPGDKDVARACHDAAVRLRSALNPPQPKPKKGN